MKGVLASFLGTFTSRYSAYRGYWLFGFLVRGLGEIEIDLLADGSAGATALSEVTASDNLMVSIKKMFFGGRMTPLDVAAALATAKFREQVIKAQLEISHVHEASLQIVKLPGEAIGNVNSHSCVGNNVSFRAVALMDNGRIYRSERILFIAPHHPMIEFRSGG
jgi:hypothetical protein